MQYGLLTIIGPIVLGLALVVAIYLNSKRSRSDEARTEDATRRMYEEQDRADKASDISS